MFGNLILTPFVALLTPRGPNSSYFLLVWLVGLDVVVWPLYLVFSSSTLVLRCKIEWLLVGQYVGCYSFILNTHFSFSFWGVIFCLWLEGFDVHQKCCALSGDLSWVFGALFFTLFLCYWNQYELMVINYVDLSVVGRALPITIPLERRFSKEITVLCHHQKGVKGCRYSTITKRVRKDVGTLPSPGGFCLMATRSSSNPWMASKPAVLAKSVGFLVYLVMCFLALMFNEKVLSKLAAPFEFMLVKKFILRRPNLDVIHRSFVNIKLSRSFSIGLLDQHYIEIQLSNDLDYSYIFSHRANCIQLLVLKASFEKD
ncbi:hypothetical protein IEQ34_017621 [Dendrobium chrysotoxum]|uniref:Uncharacterized protein n=1 Tax=Dendrobium chrysotoxum TaxID=161865 RepID=A0AAV7GAN4_DENCH|nr:hypothetical protein IEQ34_017621 [Dendrobium chrysotoxum]